MRFPLNITWTSITNDLHLYFHTCIRIIAQFYFHLGIHPYNIFIVAFKRTSWDLISAIVEKLCQESRGYLLIVSQRNVFSRLHSWGCNIFSPGYLESFAWLTAKNEIKLQKYLCKEFFVGIVGKILLQGKKQKRTCKRRDFLFVYLADLI